MKIKAVYEDNVFKPFKKPDLPEKAEVNLTVRESFSHLLDELQGLEAKEDIDENLNSMRRKKYYE
ncbi:MAG: antitoxin family protein [Methanotrichaceae archaeon]